MLTAIQEVLHQALQSEFSYQCLSTGLRIQDVPKGKEGEFSFCVAPLASHLGGVNPSEAAQKLSQWITQADADSKMFESVKADGIFVNFKIAAYTLVGSAIAAAHQGFALPGNRQKVIGVEYLSPNTNKPLHLGHVRNGVLGTALSNLYRILGHPVVKLMLINDRGVHIMKSMLAYKLFGNGKTPQDLGQKPDHFVGDFYVLYGKADAAEREKLGLTKDDSSSFDQAIARMLKEWEEGDERLHDLWNTMNAWVYAGFDTTNSRYGFTFDQVLYESNTYKGGKSIAEEGLRKGIFKKDDSGAILFRFPESFGLDKDKNPLIAEVLRADGTSNYLTQDLEVAVRKVVDHNLHRSLYVVANEQDDYFRRLFYILKELGYPWVDRLLHYSYGMVELPSGRMKSREGTVVDADELADEMKTAAKTEMLARGNILDEEELDRRADIIGLAAIKFFFLKSVHTSKIVFDPDRALDFEGDTGPYCLYTYARIRSLLRKVAERKLDPVDVNMQDLVEADSVERALAKKLLLFPSAVRQAAVEESPVVLATAILGIARAFNRMYMAHRILDDPGSAASRARVALAEAVKVVLERGLGVLGIELLEEM